MDQSIEFKIVYRLFPGKYLLKFTISIEPVLLTIPFHKKFFDYTGLSWGVSGLVLLESEALLEAQPKSIVLSWFGMWIIFHKTECLPGNETSLVDKPNHLPHMPGIHGCNDCVLFCWLQLYAIMDHSVLYLAAWSCLCVQKTEAFLLNTSITTFAELWFLVPSSHGVSTNGNFKC